MSEVGDEDLRLAEQPLGQGEVGRVERLERAVQQPLERRELLGIRLAVPVVRDLEAPLRAAGQRHARQVLGERLGEVAGGLGQHVEGEAPAIELERRAHLDGALADAVTLARLHPGGVAHVLDRLVELPGAAVGVDHPAPRALLEQQERVPARFHERSAAGRLHLPRDAELGHRRAGAGRQQEETQREAAPPHGATSARARSRSRSSRAIVSARAG